MIRQQQLTLKTSVSVQGVGLHTGEECVMTLRPGVPDSGIVFVTPGGEIPAAAENVCSTDRSTDLSAGNAEVRTVEHILAALAGMAINNARVDIEGPEIPAGDGSALPFVGMIEEAGIEVQPGEARTVRLARPVWATDSDKYLLAVPAEKLKVTAFILFQHPLIGEQAVSVYVDRETFMREIAPARTFSTGDEIETLLSRGLGKGGTEENVVVVYRDRCSTPLRFPDEFVRHKVLDTIGDLSLAGCKLGADVTSIKAGHALNIALVREILGRSFD